MATGEFGHYVTTIQLDVDPALKNLKTYSGQVKYLNGVVKEIEASERKYGETLTSTGNKQKILTELQKKYEDQVKSLDKQLDSQNKALEVYNKKKSDGVELTKQEERALHALEVQNDRIQKQRTDANTSLAKTSSELESVSNRLKEVEASSDGVLKTQNQIKAEIEANKLATKAWKDEVDRLKDGFDLVGKGANNIKDVMQKLAVPTIALGTAAFKGYMDYETNLSGVTRLSRGDASQTKALVDSIDAYTRSVGHNTEDILNTGSVLIKQLDPADYGKLVDAIDDVTNFSIASDMSSGDVAEVAQSLLSSLQTTVDDLPKIFSSLNQVENIYGSNLQDQIQILDRSLALGKNAGFDYTDMAGLAGFFSVNNAGINNQGLGSNLGKLVSLIGEAGFNDTKDKDGSVVASDIQADIIKLTSASSLNELKKLIRDEPLDVLVNLLKGYQREADARDVTLQQVLSEREYLPSDVNLSGMIATAVSKPEEIAAYVGEAQKGYQAGTATDEEAESVKETTQYQLQERWNALAGTLRDLGEALKPHVITVIDALIPHVEDLINFLKELSKVDPAVTKAVVDTMVSMFKAWAVYKTTLGVSQIGLGIFKGGKALSTVGKEQGISGIAKLLLQATTGKATGGMLTGAVKATGASTATSVATGAVASGAGAKAVGLMGSLGSSLLTVSGALTGIGVAAGAILVAAKAHDEYQKKQRVERAYDGLDEELEVDVRKDIESGSVARAKMGFNSELKVELSLSESEIQGMLDSITKQRESIKERVDYDAGQLSFTETGDADYDAKMAEAMKERIEQTKTYGAESVELERQMYELIEEVQNGTGEWTSKQVAEFQKINDRMDEVYALVLGGDDEGSRKLWSTLKEKGDLSSLGVDEANELIEAGKREIEAIDRAARVELEVANELFRESDKTQTDIDNRNKSIEAVNASKEAEIRDLYIRMGELYLDRGFFESFKLDDYFKDGYGDLSKGEMGKLSSGTQTLNKYGEAGNNLSLFDEADVAKAEEVFAMIEAIKSDDEAVIKIGNSGDLGVLMEIFSGYGVEKLVEFKEIFSGVMPEDEFDAVFDNLQANLELIREGGAIAGYESLYIATSVDEVTAQIISAYDLWDNEEFVAKAMEVDFKGEDAQSDILNLIYNYVDQIPEELLSYIKVDSTDAITEINKVTALLNDLNDRTSTPKINIDPLKITKMYAGGTNYHEGGLAVVGDGGRQEPILTPSGGLYLSDNKPQLVNLERGSKVFSSINKMMEQFGIPHYANGTARSFIDELQTTHGSGDTNINLSVKGVDWIDSDAIKQVVTDELKRQKRHDRRYVKNGGR